VSGNNHEPKALSQFVLAPPNNFSKTTPNPIPNDGAANAT
jgi:hypothetical protein